MTKEQTLGSVATLLEFYDRQELHEFFHKIDEYEQEVEDVFPWMANKLLEELSKGHEMPSFKELASQFLRYAGLPLDAFFPKNSLT